MARFVPITRKINTIILVSLIAGIGAITFYFGRSLSREIENSTGANLERQSEILYSSIENFMLPGEAPLAVSFFEEIENRNPDYMIKLLRSDGTTAFKDNNTLIQVNANIGMRSFDLRETEEPPERNIETDFFSIAASLPPDTAVFQQVREKEIFFRLYKPLINKPKCTGCHGVNHTIRGVIDIQSNITASAVKQKNSIIIAGSLFLGMVILLSLLLTQFMRTAVIQPVKLIGEVCGSVTRGSFEKRVAYDKNDELGELGKTVNQMVEGLIERFELSKYVSSSTIENLKADQRGKKLPVTLLFSDIRGFTSFSEKQTPEEVVAVLNGLLGFQTDIIHDCGGDIDKYVGDEIVAMFTRESGDLEACRAALKIRQELDKCSEEKYAGLQVGIGINTGEVILGMVGSQRRADFTVIGDNVNVTARLCSAARMGQILLSDSSYRNISDKIITEGPFKLKVKGKDNFIKIYILTGIQGE